VASKNNRIIIKPGRTRVCVVCLATPLSQRLTNYGSIQWSMILQKKKRREIDEEDDARQRTWRYVCIYVCMAVIKLRLDTQLQAVVIGLKSADREWWLLVIMNEDDWLLLFLFQASRGTTLILLVFFLLYTLVSRVNMNHAAKYKQFVYTCQTSINDNIQRAAKWAKNH